MKTMLPPNSFRLLRATCAAVIVSTLVFHSVTRAADTIYTNGSTAAAVSGNWNTVTWTKTGTASANTFPTTTDIGNVAQNLGTMNATTTSTVVLNVPVTIGALYVGVEGTTIANWTLNSDGVGTHVFTLNGTGISAANQAFGNAGIAAIASRSGGTLTLNPDVVMASNLDVGTTSNQNGNLIINGNTTATTASSLNFRGSTANANVNGTVTINGNIGASGSAIAVSNLRSSSTGTSGNVVINGNLGSSVSTVTQNGVATMILAGTNTYAGTTTITSGTLQLGNGGATGSLLGTGSIVDNGNFTISRSNAIVQGTSFGTISGSGSVTLAGIGTTTFNAANTYAGATTINRGTLNLGGSTSTGSIAATSALTLGGGALNYTRTGTNTQTFAGTTINPGASAITAAAGDTIALGAITRNVGGTVEFGTTGTITTTTANTNSILGGYATFGKNDWATASGSTPFTVAQYAGYTTYDNVASFSTGVGTTANLTDDNTGYDNTTTGALTINSLRFNVSGNDSIINQTGGTNLTITSGGILVTANTSSIKYQKILGGGLTTGTAQDLIVQENGTGSGRLQIGASIFGTGGLTKSGVGTLELSVLDAAYTGVTTVNGGNLILTAATMGTSNVTVNNSGTLMLGANDRINNAATVTLNGGTINTGGFKEGAATGASAATTGLGALTLISSSTLDFGAGHAGSSVLAFANSSAVTWSGTLTLLDFTPGTDFLNFASSTGLTSTQLSEISLAGFAVTGLDSFGDVTFTAVPEPATVLGGALLAGAAVWRKRRSLRSLLDSRIE